VPERLRSPLEGIQNELFDLGADLSVPPAAGSRERLRIGQERIDALERLCDGLNAELEPLRSFVLPGGGEADGRLHLARAICRRAERDVLVAAAEHEQSPLLAVYLNRLSDLLFIFGRVAAGPTASGSGAQAPPISARVGKPGLYWPACRIRFE